MFPLRLGIETNRKQELLAFQKQAGIKFKDLRLLDLAFHHKSYSNEHNNFQGNNERLEFLGDSVLGMVITAYLYQNFKNKTEGELAKVKSQTVSEKSLSKVACNLQISKYLVLGRGEELSGGRQKKAILADTVEAIIGAYYLDSGFKAVERFILAILNDILTSVIEWKVINDYKSLLQEFVQKKFKIIPRYDVQKVTGPDHDKTFWILLNIKNKTYGPLSGKTKKITEQNLAKLAYEDLTS